jgi:hypothetical protein
LLTSETGLGALLVRLGVVAGCVLGLVVLVTQSRHLLTTKPPAVSGSAAPTTATKPTIKALSPTNPALAASVSAGQSPADIIASDMQTRFDARFSVQPANNADYVEAAKLMVPAPPQTEPGLRAVDPRRLRANFQRGLTAMRSDVQDQIASGARLVSVAAILGYEPARVLMAQRYPSSPIIRATVSSVEAVRYSLDPLITSGAPTAANRTFLVLLASYFSGRQALQNYATDLLAVLGDDRRLQSGESLELLLSLLARVRGACTAIAVTVAKARTLSGPECSPALQLQVQNYIHLKPPPGFEAESRRMALRLFDDARDPGRSVARSPTAD